MPYPLRKKLNPIWWFQNERDPNPPDNFKPNLKKWKRRLLWFVRNPFHNFFWYVVGVDDNPNTKVIYWKFPGGLYKPEGGWNFSIIRLRILFFPFISYSGDNITFYLGWRPRGGPFGIKLSS